MTRQNATPARSAALYLRRSSAKDHGSNRSLVEQEAECRALAKRATLDVVEVYREREGTGASTRSRKTRPEWTRALADLDRGDRFETVIVWALDRADRRGADTLAALLTSHAATGRRILGVDGTDTSDERQRLTTIIRGEIAREEAESIAKRVTRTKRARRDEGRWLGGPTPFGLMVETVPDAATGKPLKTGRLVHDPATYAVARRIADEVLEGSTLWAVVARLNAEGVPSPRGGSWRVPSVAALLRSPGWAGLQSIRHRLPSGAWAAVADVYIHPETRAPVSVGVGVITPAERRSILEALWSRSAATGTDRSDGAERRRGDRRGASLLGDFLACPRCGNRSTLSGAVTSRSYRCGNAAQGPGRCAGFSAPAETVDDFVGRAFRQRLAALEPGDALLDLVAEAWADRADPREHERRNAAEDALALAREALARLQRLALSGVLDETEAAREAVSARRRIAEAEACLAEFVRAVDLGPLLDVAATEEAWSCLPASERRALLALAVERVEVTPASGRGYRFDPLSRVQITWADGTTSRRARADAATAPAPAPTEHLRRSLTLVA